METKKGEKEKVSVSLQDEQLEEEDLQENKYLTFFLGNEEFAIDIFHVVEIIGMQDITIVPDVEAFVKGVINLRGKVIPVMDTRMRFGFKERAYDERTCIVVLLVNNCTIGIIVDRVSEVLDILPEAIEPVPDLRKKKHNRFLEGLGKVGEKVILILNADKMFFDKTE